MIKYLLSCIFFLLSISSAFSQKISKEIEYEKIELIDGTSIEKNQLENKVIIANLWGTWCTPCIKEIPDLNQLVEKYSGNDNVLFLAIASPNFDDTDKIIKFLQKREFKFLHMKPEKESIFFNQIGTVKYPTTLVYNVNGKLKKKFVDTLKPKQVQQLTGLIDELLLEL